MSHPGITKHIPVSKPSKRSKTGSRNSHVALIRCFTSNLKALFTSYLHIYTNEIFHFHNKSVFKSTKTLNCFYMHILKTSALNCGPEPGSCVDLVARCAGFAIPVTHCSRPNVTALILFFLCRFHVSLPQSLAGARSILLCSGTREPNTSQRLQPHKAARYGQILEQG